jgi:CheY-like chemotaxis protein
VTLAPDNILSLSPGTYIRLAFTDQGCGIAENDLKKIFDPYFTTKPAGNGLGLASVHSIIYKHGGHIGAASVIGSGTTFTIHLPSTGETYSKHQAEYTAESLGVHSGGSILVMDDEKLIRDMSTEMLDYLGYHASTCEDGKEAIRLYKTAIESGMPYSAVIMDLTIPGGMGGKETAQQVLAIDPEACLIVSSGYSNDPILSDYRSYGFAGAVSKPYSLNELGQQLSMILSKR